MALFDMFERSSERTSARRCRDESLNILPDLHFLYPGTESSNLPPRKMTRKYRLGFPCHQIRTIVKQ